MKWIFHLPNDKIEDFSLNIMFFFSRKYLPIHLVPYAIVSSMVLTDETFQCVRLSLESTDQYEIWYIYLVYLDMRPIFITFPVLTRFITNAKNFFRSTIFGLIENTLQWSRCSHNDITQSPPIFHNWRTEHNKN